MPRPGVDVFIMDEPMKAEANLDPSQSFMVGFTERGRVGIVQSFTEYKNMYGGRTADTVDLYDAAREFFEESGGATLYISPMYGPAASEAEADLGTIIHVSARGAGVWGNTLVVKTLAPTSMTELAMGGVVFQVLDGTDEVERSPAYSTVDQAVSWSELQSNYVIFEKLADTAPTTSLTATLAGGADDYTWDDTLVADCLEKFPYELGPGQVSAPGHNDVGTIMAIGQHTLDTYRVGIIDLEDSADPNDLATEMGSVWDIAGARNLISVGPRLIYPHETNPATIITPASGAMSGIIARCDKRGDPSLSAAGVDGYSARALGLSQQYADSDRQELNNLGCSLWKNVYGQIRMYGYRTSAGPAETNWMFFQESRVIMMIAHECNSVLEEFVLKTIDGKRAMLSRVNTALSGVCARYWIANALYGETSGEAFQVDTFAPNSLATIAKGELHANILLKTSKLAEWIVLNLIKYRTERPFPAAA